MSDGDVEKGKGKGSSSDVPGDNVLYVIMFGGMTPPTDKNGNQFPEDHEKTQKWKDIMTERRVLTKQLKEPKVGLQVFRRKSADEGVVYILVGASNERLEFHADMINMKVKLKEKYGGGFDSYELDKKDHFEPYDSASTFSTLQKINLLRSIMEGDKELGCVGISLRKLVKTGVITKVFPLHEESLRRQLEQDWTNPKNIHKPQPLDRIASYFGEEIALYFAWLGFYTQWLWLSSAIGVIAFIFWIVDKTTDSQWSIWALTIYSIFLALWASFFLETWKRKNNELNYKWGTMDFTEQEVERPDFIGEDTAGFYSEGSWIEIDHTVDYGVKIPKSKYYPRNKRTSKFVASLPLIATMITMLVIATFAILSFRLFVQRKGDAVGGSFAGAIVNAIVIIAFNLFWKQVALRLTEWENHRLETEFNNSLISKLFAFYFVNSYTSLYYIAFFKRANKFWGVDYLQDACKTGDSPITISWGCPDELTLQLGTILAVNMFIGQTREVLMPWLISKIKLKLFLRKAGGELLASNLSQWEKEAKRPDFPGTLDEYSEMVIQYGYITLFAAAFPVAPLLALANNIIEIRTDAFKLCSAYTRPHYKGAQNIGTWYFILEFLGITAVITNCMIIGLSLRSLYAALGDENNKYREFQVLGIVVILEHVVLFTKYMIAALVPDYPGWIKKKIASQKWINSEKERQEQIGEFHNRDWGTKNDLDDDDELKGKGNSN